MKIPFRVELLFGVFAQDNDALWPAQVIASVPAAVALTLAVARNRRRSAGFLG